MRCALFFTPRPIHTHSGPVPRSQRSRIPRALTTFVRAWCCLRVVRHRSGSKLLALRRCPKRLWLEVLAAMISIPKMRLRRCAQLTDIFLGTALPSPALARHDQRSRLKKRAWIGRRCLLRRRDGDLSINDLVAIIGQAIAVNHAVKIGDAFVRYRDRPRMRECDGIVNGDLILELVLGEPP
jgi:hypothetical protein